MKVVLFKEDITPANSDPNIFEEKISSFLIFAEAINRGYEAYYLDPEKLSYRDNQVFGKLRTIDKIDFNKKKIHLSKEQEINLEKIDVVVIRLDPPFDMQYFTFTHILDKLKRALVVNDPATIRNFPEKIYPFDFSRFSPPTLISADIDAMLDFIDEHQAAIIKPIYEYGGEGVTLFKKNDRDKNKTINALLRKYKTPLITQRFIKGVSKGDKRILIIDGKPIAGLLRIPGKGTIIANYKRGGKVVKTTLTSHELTICKALSPYLRKYGVMMCGLDVIGEYVTEINVTSPAGFHAIQEFYGINASAIFWDAVEKKL